MSSPALAARPPADTYQSARPVLYCAKGQDRVDALMYACSEWKRRTAAGGVPAYLDFGESWLGRVVRMMRLGIGGNQLPRVVVLGQADELVHTVVRIVEQLPPHEHDKRRIRQVIEEEYRAPTWWTSAQKASKCGVSRRNYYYLLKAGKALIDARVPWDRIDFVDLSRLREALLARSDDQ